MVEPTLESQLRALHQAITESKSVQIQGASDAHARLCLASLLDKTQSKKYVVVFPFEKDFLSWKAFFSSLCSSLSSTPTVCFLPAVSFWGSERGNNKTALWQERLCTLQRMLQPTNGLLVFTTLPALAQKVVATAVLQKMSCTLRLKEEQEIESLLEALQNLGYYEVSRVAIRGTYSVRGGILDIYPLRHADPVRVEFLGDVIHSIRSFYVETQLSYEMHTELIIDCASEVSCPVSKSNIQSLYDQLLHLDGSKLDRDMIVQELLSATSFPHGKEIYAPFFMQHPVGLEEYITETLFCFPSGLEACEEARTHFFERIQFEFEQDRIRKIPTVPPSLHFHLEAQPEKWGVPFLEFGNPMKRDGALEIPLSASIPLEKSLYLISQGEGASGGGLTPQFSEIFLSVETQFRRKKKRISGEKKWEHAFSSWLELQEKDLVVHFLHGVGRYQGITQLSIQNILMDFIVLEYQDRDKIYVPVDRIGQIQKYVGGSDHATLDRLRSQGWIEKKAKAQRAIIDIAAGLIHSQANRTLALAERYAPASSEYERFVEDFPYQETDDQLEALIQIEQDLSRDRPMDRLVIGDVGFGKTEIAMRTMMRAILEGRQVLVVVPTTLLCFQHFQTFRLRFERYGVNVAAISRLVAPKKRKEILEALQAGRIDIVVGTHTLLRHEVQPPRLGLVVIDEEQKFGVLHKEKWRELAPKVDFLTLSATPIPRSLHMALSGLRDISILATPPVNRMSIKTVVTHFSEELVQAAIEQEVKRGGQVFFVHHRVQDIEGVAALLQRICPQVGIRVAHGQMPESDMERIFLDFVEKRFSVLVSTTIIESGMDLPNVNTLIVNHAEHFGLSQLYQLRGRVGRSSTQAYAYFLPSQHVLSEDARKRLDTLVAHQELGAGFYIAKADLEIRGAGNLLGSQQSGHVTSIGLELYTEMLHAEVQRQQDKPVVTEIDPEIKLSISALIPKSYIESEPERLTLYQKLFSVQAEEELGDIQHAVEDRYGKAPPPFAALLQVAMIRFWLKQLKMVTLWQEGDRVYGRRASSEEGFLIYAGSLHDDFLGKVVEKLSNSMEFN